MKKIIVLSLLLLLVIFSVSAADNYQCIIVAYDGVSGIPIGSENYLADTDGKWGSKNDSKSNYGDTDMIGLIQFLNVTGGRDSTITLNGKITVTIQCPNGYYLTSQSNPNYKRPFEIVLFPNSKRISGGAKKISENSPTAEFTVNGTYDHFHFDVVIRLPGDVDDNTQECTVGNVAYPLIEEDDYASVVTFDVKYYPSGSSTATITKTVTIPFAGYYKKGQTAAHNGDGYANISMSIIMNSEAYNIDMKNKCGVWIPIGELYFNMMFGKKLKSSVTKKAAIFFSTSEDPFDKNAETFTMVHDDVGVDVPLSSLNSKTFTLRVVSDEDGTYRTFDGKTYFNTDYTEENMDKYYIFFNQADVKTDYMWDYYQQDTDYEKAKQVRSYYRYSGKIEIMLADNDITMHEGRYTETIYVHVMVYQ